MKKITLFQSIIFLLLLSNFTTAQTLESFETESDGATSFTSGSKTFSITNGIVEYPGVDAFGAGDSNFYIDNSSSCGVQSTLSFSTNDGSDFYMNSLYIYTSTDCAGVPVNTSNSILLKGFKDNSEEFSITVSNWSNEETNGFTLVDLTSLGYGDTAVDEIRLDFSASTVQYAAIDEILWSTIPTGNFNRENFESAIDDSTTFTNNGQSFTTTNSLRVQELGSGQGVNDSQILLDNLDASPSTIVDGGTPYTASIQTTDGTDIFLRGFYLYMSNNGANAIHTVGVTVNGYKDGSGTPAFSQVFLPPFDNDNENFNFIDISSVNEAISIDRIEIVPSNNTAGGANEINYFAVDNLYWSTASVPVSASINDPSVAEGASGNTTLQFTVSLDNPAPAGGATVDYATSSGTATSGSDYTAIGTTTLSFVAGETSKTVDVTVSGDSMVEIDETLTITLSNPTGTDVSITDSTGTGTITNDDSTTVTIADVSVNENSGTATIIATLNNAVDGGFDIDVSTADGTATTADSDYTSVTSQTLTFAGTSGETETFNVTLGGDTKVEADETVSISMSGLSPVTVASGDIDITDGATLTLNNDDAAAVTIADVSGNENGGSITVTATLDNAVQGGFTVDLSTSDGTATTGDSDYTSITSETLTFAGTAGETQTFTFVPTGDTKLESNETVTFSQSNLASTVLAVNITDGATGTILNDDAAAVTIADVSGNENGGSVTVTATLDNAVQGGFTVDVSTSDGTATTGDSDYTSITSETLTFAGNAGETQTFTFVPTGDTKLESNETVTFSQSNLASTALAVNITDGATGTILNDDAASVTIADVSGNENGGSITVTATLDNAVQGGFTVDVSTSDGTATTGDSDYTSITSETLTFAGTAGETQTFTFVPTGDTKLESNETVTFSQSNLASTTLSVNITDGATGTILNDDAAAVTIADVSGNEDDGAITVTATLDNAVQGGFSIDVNTTDGTATTVDNDYTSITSETLNFTGNAGETQTFTVTPISDTDLESDEQLSIFMNNLASTVLAVNITDGATATILNDDVALSINTVENIDLSIYPNPVKDVLYLKVENVKIENIELFNILGKSVKNIQLKNTTIDVSAVNSGMYILQIKTEKGITTKRIIKE